MSEFGNDNLGSVGIGESVESSELGKNSTADQLSCGASVGLRSLLVGLDTEDLGSELQPWDRLGVSGKILALRVLEEAHLLPSHGDLAESLVSHSTSDEVLDVLETVKLFELAGVSVRVADQVVCRGKVVRSSRGPGMLVLHGRQNGHTHIKSFPATSAT